MKVVNRTRTRPLRFNTSSKQKSRPSSTIAIHSIRKCFKNKFTFFLPNRIESKHFVIQCKTIIQTTKKTCRTLINCLLAKSVKCWVCLFRQLLLYLYDCPNSHRYNFEQTIYKKHKIKFVKSFRNLSLSRFIAKLVVEQVVGINVKVHFARVQAHIESLALGQLGHGLDLLCPEIVLEQSLVFLTEFVINLGQGTDLVDGQECTRNVVVNARPEKQFFS